MPDPGPIAAAPSIPARFARIARQHADRPAVLTDAVEWSYAELQARSSTLAAQLLERLGPEAEPVALLMAHEAPLIAAILAVLQAGKIYLALDPSHPPERLRAMLAESGTRLLYTDAAQVELGAQLAQSGLEMLVLDTSAESPRQPLGPLPEVNPEAGAWLMFTSGSTGRPKGVWQNHRSAVRQAETYGRLIDLTPEDRVSLLTSCSLSSSGSALFGALLHGAAIAPFPVRSRGLAELARWLRERRIGVYHSVPTVFRQLARLPEAAQALASLRLVRLGGETVRRSDVEIFQRLCPPHCRFLQSFSSTETGLITSWSIGTQTALRATGWHVGHAVEGVRIDLLDEGGEAVAPGEPGLIAITSEDLRQGYWRNPEMTAQRYSNAPGSRLRTFRSQDLGRLLPDGSLEHLGRADDQVKIGGLRVDLAELETELGAHPDLVECAGVATDRLRQGWQLGAFYVARTGASPSADDLRNWLAQRLPAHCVPARFIALDALPLTSSGKVDRRELARRFPAEITSKNEPSAPRNGLEQQLLEIWRTVFGNAAIGPRDHFFELGGDSLGAVRLTLEIEQRFGRKLPTAALLQSPTVESMARLVASQAEPTAWGSLVTLQPAGSKPPLYLIHGWGGDVTGFLALIRHLPADQPVVGVRALGLDGRNNRATSVDEMVAHYTREIRAAQPGGPYYLGGYSLGGLIAFELAQQLRREGQSVAMLALLDARLKRLDWLSWSRAIAGYLPSRGRQHLRSWRALPLRRRLAYLGGRWKALRYWLQNNAAKRRVLIIDAPPPGTAPRPTEPPDYYQSLISGHRARPYDGTADLFLCADTMPLAELSWRQLVRGGLAVHRLAAQHDELLAATYAPALGAALSEVLALRQREQAPRYGNS